MSKKKKETKKISVKKAKYAKFRREKSAQLNISAPDLTPEQQKQKQLDEAKINSFLRYSKNRPTLSLREKKAKSKK
jgi:hypothetical protein